MDAYAAFFLLFKWDLAFSYITEYKNGNKSLFTNNEILLGYPILLKTAESYSHKF